MDAVTGNSVVSGVVRANGSETTDERNVNGREVRK